MSLLKDFKSSLYLAPYTSKKRSVTMMRSCKSIPDGLVAYLSIKPSLSFQSPCMGPKCSMVGQRYYYDMTARNE